MMTATEFSTDRSYTGEWWAIELNGKVIAHIRPHDDRGTSWCVHRVDRNGLSNPAPTPRKAAAAYGFRVDKWFKANGSEDRERLETKKPAATERQLMEAMAVALGTRSPYEH